MATNMQSRSRAFPAIVALVLALCPMAPAAGDITSAPSLDETDQQARRDALDRVLAGPPGAEESWSNIDSGHRGAFKSMSERPGEGGESCRDIAETVWLEDNPESGTLVACRSGDDPWRIVSGAPPPEGQAPTEAAPVSQPPGLGNLPVQIWVGAPHNGAGTVVVPAPASGAP